MLFCEDAAIAQWIHPPLPSCGPGFESQVHHYIVKIFLYICQCIEKRTKINKKRPGLAPYFKFSETWYPASFEYLMPSSLVRFDRAQIRSQLETYFSSIDDEPFCFSRDRRIHCFPDWRSSFVKKPLFCSAFNSSFVWTKKIKFQNIVKKKNGGIRTVMEKSFCIDSSTDEVINLKCLFPSCLYHGCKKCFPRLRLEQPTVFNNDSATTCSPCMAKKALLVEGF